MRIWRIEEESEYPPLALAVATIWTPARWRAVRSVAWVTHADEALRSLFPNLPERIEGPWGSLSRSDALGPEEACSAMLDAMEGISLSEGGKIDKIMELGSFSLAAQSLHERVEQGKLGLLDALIPSSFSMSSQVASMELQLDASFYKGDKTAALEKIDALIGALDASLASWMPSLHRLPDPSALSRDDLDRSMAKARLLDIGRSAAPARRPAGPSRSL